MTSRGARVPARCLPKSSTTRGRSINFRSVDASLSSLEFQDSHSDVEASPSKKFSTCDAYCIYIYIYIYIHICIYTHVCIYADYRYACTKRHFCLLLLQRVSVGQNVKVCLNAFLMPKHDNIICQLPHNTSHYTRTLSESHTAHNSCASQPV